MGQTTRSNNINYGPPHFWSAGKIFFGRLSVELDPAAALGSNHSATALYLIAAKNISDSLVKSSRDLIDSSSLSKSLTRL